MATLGNILTRLPATRVPPLGSPPRHIMPNPAAQEAPAVNPAAQERLEAARQFALEAGTFTLQHFRCNRLGVERKGDGSPVTVADRGAEELLRKRIAEQFPDDAILGEEFPETAGTSGYRWILDPIDGTKAFIHGVPLYTTLVAVLEEATGEPILGVIHSPASGETIHAAVGEGAWYQHGDNPLVRASVSDIQELGQGLFVMGEVSGFCDRNATETYLALQNAALLTRGWGDAYGYMMVAIGRAEVMIDPAMSLWDAACLKPIVEEAGGTFTNWNGEPTVHAGEGVATNGHLAEQVLAHTRGEVKRVTPPQRAGT